MFPSALASNRVRGLSGGRTPGRLLRCRECPLSANFSREPPFLLRELSYMRELPPKRADSPQERIGGVDGGGC
jgi:hypothetical protein